MSLDSEVKAAVADVLIAYARRFDGRDLDGVIELFDPDVEADMGAGVLRGREAVRESLAGSLDQLALTSHLVGNIVVTGEDGGPVHAVSTVHAVVRGQDGSGLGLAMEYGDTLWRNDTGAWRIVRRTIAVRQSYPIEPTDL
jgi:3-phenylpropionate/cinnamic acid dioxygenase small subunit